MNMEERPLFVIPAVPSSGSSALAGVLFYLGVDMGKLDHDVAVAKRGYEMFEDKNIWKYCSVPNREPGKVIGNLSNTSMRFRSYVNRRIMDADGPIGVKIPAIMCMQDMEPKSMDVVALNIHRSFEKCLMSDRKTLLETGKYEALEGSVDKILMFNIMRAGDMGACLACKMDFLSIHEPVVNITFDELVNDKESIVPDIAEALCLDSSDEQIQNAIDFLDKDKKHS